MATVPFVFAPQTGPIPLSELDANFTALSTGGPAAGAALVGFLQTGVGAVGRTVQSRLQETFSVLDFGAVGDGATDNTTAIQNAVNACTGVLLFPEGVFICGPVTISNALVIQGVGSGDSSTNTGTIIQTNGPTANVFTVNTQAAVVFRDFAMRSASAPPTAGSGITLEDTSPTMGVANQFSQVVNVRFDNMFIGVNAISASSFNVDGCVFWRIPANGIGVKLDNTFNKDQGDQCITGCTFLGDNTCIGVFWQGGGGTRIVNNKFFTSNAIWAQFTNLVAQPTAQFLIADNSIDVPNNYAAALPVQLVLTSGTVPFNNIMVTNNLFIGYFAMNTFLSISAIAAAMISKVMVIGNSFINTGGSFSGVGMMSMVYVQQFLVADNMIIGPGTSTGIYVDSTCANGSVVANEIQNVTTQITSNSTTTRVRGVTNSGATAGVSDGGTITHNLGVTPTKVWLNGSVAAQTYNPFSITSTTFQVSVRNTAGASGSAATIYWQVEA